MATTDVEIENLSNWLAQQNENTPETAYDIRIIGIDANNYMDIKSYLIANSNKYVDLSHTSIPDGITNCSELFLNCTTLVKPPSLPYNVSNLSSAFENCTSLIVAHPIPRDVLYANKTYKGCVSLRRGATFLSYTRCSEMDEMYKNCSSLITVPDVTLYVNTMKSTFENCTSLETIENFLVPLSRIKNNPNFQDMFKNCNNLKQIGFSIQKESDTWNIYRLNITHSDSTSTRIEAKIFSNANGQIETVTKVGVFYNVNNSQTLVLPVLSDELLFTNTISDSDLDDLIEDVIKYKYTYSTKTVIDPTNKSFVLYADDPDHVVTNLSFPADVSHASGVLPVANGGTGQTDLASVAVGSAGKWTTARDIKIQDSDGTNTGSAVSVDGSENETLKLPSTIKASITGNCSGSSGSCTGNSATATSATRLGSIAIANIRIGSSQAKISLNQLMTWLITTKAYIPSGVDCYKVLGVPWDYSGNDILQLSANGVNYELQLAGCVIEFMGNATNYNTGRFRLTIHSSPTNSFTVSSNYEKFPVSTAVTYTCNGSGYTPIWKIDMPIKKANGYWGFQTPKSDGTWIDSDWIRSTTQGILPYQSGNAGSGHNSLGTSSWYWKYAYIDQIYGYLNGNISGNADKVDNYHVSTASGTTKNDSLNSLVPVSKQYFTTTSGYIVYANGLKIQWGRKRASSLERYTSFTITNADMLSYTSKDSYSISFSFQKDSGNMSFCVGIQGKSASGFQAAAYGLGASDTSIELNWFTIGY